MFGFSFIDKYLNHVFIPIGFKKFTVEIRKQLIWGNTFIMFKNKSLMFDNWINSDFIYINDI
jgi:hypothetical protein